MVVKQMEDAAAAAAEEGGSGRRGGGRRERRPTRDGGVRRRRGHHGGRRHRRRRREVPDISCTARRAKLTINLKIRKSTINVEQLIHVRQILDFIWEDDRSTKSSLCPFCNLYFEEV